MIDLLQLEADIERTIPDNPTSFMNLASENLPVLIEELSKTREERDHFKSEMNVALMKIKKLEDFCDEVNTDIEEFQKLKPVLLQLRPLLEQRHKIIGQFELDFDELQFLENEITQLVFYEIPKVWR